MQLDNHIMSMMIATSVIFSKTAIDIHRRFLDDVINILYPVSFTHLFVLVFFKTLLSHIGKIYSQILNNHVVSYCKEIDLFCDEQNGFRQSH